MDATTDTIAPGERAGDTTLESGLFWCKRPCVMDLGRLHSNMGCNMNLASFPQIAPWGPMEPHGVPSRWDPSGFMGPHGAPPRVVPQIQGTRQSCCSSSTSRTAGLSADSSMTETCSLSQWLAVKSSLAAPKTTLTSSVQMPAARVMRHTSLNTSRTFGPRIVSLETL